MNDHADSVTSSLEIDYNGEVKLKVSAGGDRAKNAMRIQALRALLSDVALELGEGGELSGESGRLLLGMAAEFGSFMSTVAGHMSLDD